MATPEKKEFNQYLTDEAGWNDLVSSFSAAKGNGTTEPVWSDIGNGLYAMRFTDGDELFVTYHVMHDYLAGSKAYPHIHWFSDLAMTAGDEVVWEIQYAQAKGYNQGESLTDATTSFQITYTADGTEVAGEHIISECSAAQAFVLAEIDALVMLGVKLISSTVTGTEKIFGIMADLHYQIGQINTNDKNYPFT